MYYLTVGQVNVDSRSDVEDNISMISGCLKPKVFDYTPKALNILIRASLSSFTLLHINDLLIMGDAAVLTQQTLAVGLFKRLY